jgi:hypothetical protein
VKIVKCLNRDLVARTILVECPNCGGPLSLRPDVITNLEEGITTVGACEYCDQALELSVGALGGEVWPDPA